MIRAAIFDLDGTLADTEPLHYEAFAAVLRPEGIELPRADYFARLVGYNDHDCFALMLGENGRAAGEDRITEFISRKAALYQKAIDERDVLNPGAAEFVRRCAGRFPLAIATGTLRAEAEMILRGGGIRDAFAVIIAAEDVEHGKPEPDCFIAARERINQLTHLQPPLEAAECLVVEDTVFGVDAAHRAGMKVLALAYTSPAGELEVAELVRRSFIETDLDDVLRRLSSGK
jgi:HAD superfamily hydrolase (TIGR01509 family)